MKLNLTKANAFEIDPNKKYLLLVNPKEAWSMADIEQANASLQQHFPNMSVVTLKPGTKYKVLEADK